MCHAAAFAPDPANCDMTAYRKEAPLMVSSAQPVLVVGAGPVGLVAAAELARRGTPVRIIDKLTAPTTESRAIIVHARSLEMLDRMGLVQQVIDSGVRTTAMEMHASGRRLARLELDRVDSPFPFSVTTAQTETERILSEFLGRLGVTVERGAELVGLEQDGTSARATIRHQDSREEQLVTSFLIGADGAHSAARRLAGSALAGSFHGERFLMGDVETEHDLDPHSMYTFFASHGGPLLVFPMQGQRMRLIAQIDASGSARAPSVAWLQQVTDERAGAIQITSAHWLTIFEIHHAQVPAYRLGPVFLAGDAAHVHSPAGGQGMNTGMQDAFNLGWKLALGAGGAASPVLLDSYHAERHPVAAKVIEFTTRLTQVGTLDSSLARILRNTVMHAASGLAPVRLALANQAEETALAYRGSPAVIGAGPSRHAVHAGDHLPDVAGTGLRQRLNDEAGHVLLTIAPPGAVPAPATAAGISQILVARDAGAAAGYAAVLADPQQRAAQRLGLPAGGRVMVRPDGYVGYVSALADTATAAAYTTLLGAGPA
jgi:2-polyprenyl-6-methoxyphenol hydroxylase-like FAD-dependent oxidoreductase